MRVDSCTETTKVIKSVRSPVIANQSGADPGFFLGGGAPLRNDITDGEVKKKIKYVYTKKKASSQEGVRTPCTFPLDPPLPVQLLLTRY